MAEKKTIIKGMYNWTFWAIVIVAIILLNIISSFLNKRWDATKDQRYSLSQGTIDFLSNENSFKNRLNIKSLDWIKTITSLGDRSIEKDDSTSNYQAGTNFEIVTRKSLNFLGFKVEKWFF